MREQRAKPDREIAEIARRQHGVVADWQMRAAGLSASGISRRAAAGRLHRVHRGVYAVGHLGLSPQSEWMAAVLACGRRASVNRRSASDAHPTTATVLGYWGAALSHRSAAESWGMLAVRGDAIDVSVSGGSGKKKRRGIRVHRSLTLLSADVTLRSRIPVTNPARTIADLQRVVSRPGAHGLLSPRELRRAIRQAEVIGLSLADDKDGDRTRSDLERDFLRLCRCHRLPAPEVNVRVGPHLVDFLWRARRLVVETDGYGYHSGRVAFQDDRARDLDLRSRGFQVIRLSEKQVDEEARLTAEVVRQALRVGADAPQDP
jgi:very-short-patch-repair endonuclease/predicted transcriptional regulator of viral defense system